MIMKIFKRNGQPESDGRHPVLDRLSRMGTHSAVCTMVRTADGKETRAQIGPVSLFRKQDRLFTRGQSMYLVPPGNLQAPDQTLAGRGEILHLEFNYDRVPYSVDCQVVRRVRFSDRLLSDMQPHIPVGYKLSPVGNVRKESKRKSLRFGQLRTGGGPVVTPYFRFDLFVECVEGEHAPEDRPPRIVAYPGDDPFTDAVKSCDGPEGMVSLFRDLLVVGPSAQSEVHVTHLTTDAATGRTDLVDIGYLPVLGLNGPQNGSGGKGSLVHLKCPRAGRSKGKHPAADLREGDALVIRLVSRDPFDGRDVHYNWMCKVSRRGIETLTLRPKGLIRKQTGLSAMVSDFSVNGVGLLNSPLLETYLLKGEGIPSDSTSLQELLLGRKLLMHFHPRMHFPKDLAIYRPDVPAAFDVLGQVVRTAVDDRKDDGRIRELGVVFCHEPGDVNPETLSVTEWMPLRAMREHRHFKEIHRALNSLLAYLER